MTNKEYSSAINELKAAQKKYKKARLSQDAYNYLRVNMAHVMQIQETKKI